MENVNKRNVFHYIPSLAAKDGDHGVAFLLDVNQYCTSMISHNLIVKELDEVRTKSSESISGHLKMESN